MLGQAPTGLNAKEALRVVTMVDPQAVQPAIFASVTIAPPVWVQVPPLSTALLTPTPTPKKIAILLPINIAATWPPRRSRPKPQKRI